MGRDGRVAAGHGGRGTIGFGVRNPDATIVVEADGVIRVSDGAVPVDGFVLRGDAVALLEELSQRAPFTGDVPPAQAWMVQGLVQAFEA